MFCLKLSAASWLGGREPEIFLNTFLKYIVIPQFVGHFSVLKVFLLTMFDLYYSVLIFIIIIFFFKYYSQKVKEWTFSLEPSWKGWSILCKNR